MDIATARSGCGSRSCVATTMSISAPVLSAAWTSHPLSLTLSLDALGSPGAEPGGRIQPEWDSTPLGPTATSRECFTGHSAPPLDVLDAIDAESAPWEIEPPAGAAGSSASHDESVESVEVTGTAADADSTRSQDDSTLDHALADSHSVLYATSAEERGTAIGSDPTAGGLPEWMRDSSAHVTSMAAGRLAEDATNPIESAPPGERRPGSARRRWRRPSLRVAVGCEDGTVWVFAHPEVAVSDPPRQQEEEQAIRREEEGPDAGGTGLAPPSLASTSTLNAAGESSRSPIGAHDTLAVELGDSTRPLRSHRSSGSISTLASLASPGPSRGKRVVSASAAQLSPSAGLPSNSRSSASLHSLDSGRAHPRLRKASATVSISTSPAEPATACHSRTRTPAPEAQQRDADADLPPLPTSSSPPVSPPTSPISVASIPSVMVFPTSPADSRGETLGNRHHRRTGSRAKDSIATGIGLWETDHGSRPSSGETTPREELNPPPDLVPIANSTSADADIASRGKDSIRLEPVLKILTRGAGPVVGLAVVAGVRCADAREGVALAILRESGCVSPSRPVTGGGAKATATR